MSSPQPDPDVAETLAGQRRAAGLGPVLPVRAEAESPGAWGEDGDGAVSDEEWLREVPPHHG